MNGRERLEATLNHRQPDRVCVDIGATWVTGMHVSVVDKLRKAVRTPVVSLADALGAMRDAWARYRATAEGARQDVLDRVAAYYHLAHEPKPFAPGRSKVHYGGRVFDEREMTESEKSRLLRFYHQQGSLAELFDTLRENLMGGQGSGPAPLPEEEDER